MPDLDVFIADRHRAQVSLTVNADAEMVDEAESEAAICPGLDHISEATLLGT